MIFEFTFCPWFIATNIYYPGDFAKIICNYIIIQIIITFSVCLPVGLYPALFVCGVQWNDLTND